MSWSLLLGSAVFSSAWFLLPGGASSRRVVCTDSTSPGRSVSAAGAPVILSLLVGACALLAGWLIREAGAVLFVLVPAGVICVLVIRRLVGAWRQRQHRRRRQIEVIQLCDALAAEMRGGLPTREALERSCAGWPDLSSVVSADRVGGDVADAMRVAAAQPGAEGMRAVAAGWEVAANSGAALADVLDRIATGLRSDDEARAEVTAALGPPRATAKMLAVLPAFGLAMGMSMGAAPLDFLLHSQAGWLCLAAGVTLATLGLLWVERLAQSAEI